jgi:hypothetical protein
MSTLESLKQTAITYWAPADGCFYVETALAPSIKGIGDTAEEAQTSFDDSLIKSFEKLRGGNQTRAGRPAKNGVNIHAQISQASKDLLDELGNALTLGQGETLDCAIFAFSKQVYKKKTKLLIVSPPRKLVPVLIYSTKPIEGEVFKFRSDSKSCAADFDSHLRWEPNQPRHYRWFDEREHPIDFIAKIQTIETISVNPFLFEVAVEVTAVPPFAQKISEDEVESAQRQLRYIEQTENDGDDELSVSITCECDSDALEIQDWGCDMCPACKPAFYSINNADFKLRYGRTSRFSFQYPDLELAWEAHSGQIWKIWVKCPYFVGSLEKAPCELMLRALNYLNDFCVRATASRVAD